jgi:pSer/pThr/pTyr-binding forkhead associated (FHA) protein
MTCQSCGHDIEAHHRFCGNCGGALQARTSSRQAESVFHESATSVAKARLRLIRGDTEEKVVYEFDGNEMVVGRQEGKIRFAGDSTISPRHARFYLEQDHLYVSDEGSLNGTFIRLREPVPISDGEVFLCGEQVLCFSLYRAIPVTVGSDGAVFCGTPVAPWRFRIIQLVGNGTHGMIYCARKRVITLGRDDCDINFAHDRFISHYHTRIEERDGEYFLKDLDSRNGTYFRLKEPVPLSNGDYVFIGRQLLRVELT